MCSDHRKVSGRAGATDSVGERSAGVQAGREGQFSKEPPWSGVRFLRPSVSFPLPAQVSCCGGWGGSLCGPGEQGRGWARWEEVAPGLPAFGCSPETQGQEKATSGYVHPLPPRPTHAHTSAHSRHVQNARKDRIGPSHGSPGASDSQVRGLPEDTCWWSERQSVSPLGGSPSRIF